MKLRTVSEVARLTGVSVRTLHHYDELGLVQPERSEAGYRLYDEARLVRLHEVLTWRALGFPLQEVAELVDDPDRDPLEAMVQHRRRLVEQVGQLNERIARIDEAIGRVREEAPLRDVDLVALFDGFDPAAFEEEAEQRWGDTEAWVESKRRTARYGEAEWRAIREEQDRVNEQFVAAQAAGVAPSDEAARRAAEAHRAFVDRWFYTVTPEIHRGLAEMYVADPRFRATFEAVATGLAAFVREAIFALHTPRPRQL